MATTARVRRQLLGREERQAQILDAAARAFAEGGYAATSMEDVAAEAGVTRLIVYRHFASKEELYRSVLERTSDALRSEFLRAMNAPERARGFVSRSMLAVARRDPAGVRLLMVHAQREPEFVDYTVEHFAGAVGVADAIVGDAIADPVLKAWATRTIVAYLISSLLVWLDEGDPERDEEYVELATEGLIAMFLAWAPEAAADVPPHPG